jgi:adenylyltransferase and sulfurtransferase
LLTASDIPFSDLTTDPVSSLAGVSRDKPAFVVCRFGNDSQIAVEMMGSASLGFRDVKDLKGGLNAWAEAYPDDIVPKY